MPPSLVTLLAGNVRKLYETPAIVALVWNEELLNEHLLYLIMYRYFDATCCSDPVTFVRRYEDSIRLKCALDETEYTIEPFDLEIYVKTVEPRLATIILSGDRETVAMAVKKRIVRDSIPSEFDDMYFRMSGEPLVKVRETVAVVPDRVLIDYSPRSKDR